MLINPRNQNGMCVLEKKVLDFAYQDEKVFTFSLQNESYSSNLKQFAMGSATSALHHHPQSQ